MAKPAVKKALHWSAFFVVCLLAASAFAEPCAMPATAQPVVNSYVIDGDTLVLTDQRRVRLIGIDAPEIGYRSQPSESFAREARAELERVVRGAELRLLVGQQPKDKYGRTLGHLFADGVNVEALLLRSGLAFTVGIAPNLALLDCHLQHERLARQDKIGLWAHSPIQSATGLKKSGFHVLRGQVTKVERTGRYFWLDLDGPITLRVASHDLHLFPDAANWAGRTVEVRGWVIERKPQRGRKRFMMPLLEPRLTTVD